MAALQSTERQSANGQGMIARLVHHSTDDTGALVATGETNPLPVSAKQAIVTGSSGLSVSRRQNLDETPRAIKASAGKIFGLTLINPNAEPIFVKICNIAAASVTAGNSTVQHTVEVPANDGTNDGQLIITPGAFPLFEFDTAISFYAVEELADNGTTGPTSDLHAEVFYA